MRTSVRFTLGATALCLFWIGCNGESPTSPPPFEPPAAQTASIWGHVVQANGLCLVDATVEIIDGPGVGQKVVQKDGSCSLWDYSSEYTLRDLPVGATVRLRASREGYIPEERAVVVTTSRESTDFVLRKL